jgi:hypothetical protein
LPFVKSKEGNYLIKLIQNYFLPFSDSFVIQPSFFAIVDKVRNAIVKITESVTNKSKVEESTTDKRRKIEKAKA